MALEKELFTLAEVELILGRKVSTLRKDIRTGKLPYVRLGRQLRIVRSLGDAAFFRHPDAWNWCFEGAASRVGESHDLPRAQTLVREGRKALDRGDTGALKTIVEQLWRLLPAEAKERRLSFDSGLR